MPLQISSTAFSAGQAIPKKFTCDGPDVSLQLKWDDPPANTQAFALIMDDPDAPAGTWVHWVVLNIPPETRELKSAPGGKIDIPGAIQGKNDFKKLGYGGPAPPSGTHHYHFKLAALDVEELSHAPTMPAADIWKAAEKHMLGQTELVGTYGR